MGARARLRSARTERRRVMAKMLAISFNPLSLHGRYNKNTFAVTDRMSLFVALHAVLCLVLRVVLVLANVNPPFN